MKIIIDCEYDKNGLPSGYHYFETDLAQSQLVDKPGDPSAKLAPLDYIKHLDTNKDMHAQAGWSEISKLPGLPGGTTRWDVLVSECAKAAALPELKALNLTKGK